MLTVSYILYVKSCVCASHNDTRLHTDNKEPCCAAHKGAPTLPQKSAFNLFSYKEKPFIVCFLLVLLFFFLRVGVGRVTACVRG